MKKTIFFFLLIFSSIFIRAQNEFITVWKPSITQSYVIQAPYASSNQQIWFPGIGNNFNITWEEVGYPSHNGTINGITSTKQFIIDFGSPFNPIPQNATYRVKTSNGNGIFNQIHFFDEETNPSLGISLGDNYKIISIEQWGNIQWSTMKEAFDFCINLNVTATDVPHLSQVTTLKRMFKSCQTLIGNASFNNWNISTVTDLNQTFYNAVAFNQPLGNWNTSNVINLEGTFNFALNFNQPLNNWNVSNVTTLHQLFWGATAFNQPLNNWDISKVTSLEETFSGASSFNQPLSNWNVSNVTTFRMTFAQATNFNQPLDEWNMSNAINIGEMFRGAKLFNQSINSWNVSNVIMLNGIFCNTQNFNQDLYNWNTAKVEFMYGAFMNATAFNKPINTWNTTSVKDMGVMFKDAYNYNQNMSNWNLNNLTSATDMFLNSGLGCTNYSSILIGWAANPNTPNYINLGNVSPLSYNSQAINSRNNLISKNWLITGDSLGNCQLSVNESNKKDLEIYPNPAKDFLFIEKENDFQEFIIYDYSGKLIQKKYFDKKIDIRNLLPGIYYLKLISNSKKDYIHKFIKN